LGVEPVGEDGGESFGGSGNLAGDVVPAFLVGRTPCLSGFNFLPFDGFAGIFFVGECPDAKFAVKERRLNNKGLFQLEIDELSDAALGVTEVFFHERRGDYTG